MATITASMFMALDGVVDPMVGNWHFPYFNEDMGEAVTATHDADVMLFGRVTYDSFAGAWPEREAAGEAAAALKNDPAIRRIALSGSVSVVRQLLDAGLLDELHLFVHPATAGSGLRLFEEGGPARPMKLLSCRPFTSGVVYLVY